VARDSSAWTVGELVCQRFDASVDVVADQAYAVDTVDAAVGGFVGVPVLQFDANEDANEDVDGDVPAEGDDEVDGA